MAGRCNFVGRLKCGRSMHLCGFYSGKFVSMYVYELYMFQSAMCQCFCKPYKQHKQLPKLVQGSGFPHLCLVAGTCSPLHRMGALNCITLVKIFGLVHSVISEKPKIAVHLIPMRLSLKLLGLGLVNVGMKYRTLNTGGFNKKGCVRVRCLSSLTIEEG